jgi:hypothetical protein
MEKISAVEWLMNEIENRIVRINPHNTIIIQTQVDTFNELFEKAKQMEREQLIEHGVRCYSNCCGEPDRHAERESEHIYNNTFKSK